MGTPTEPGWYAVKYTGYKSGKPRVDVVQLGFSPKNSVFRGALCYVSHCKYTGDEQCSEINFHPNCNPVEWSDKLPVPF